MASLGSFLSANQYTKETISVPFVAAMLAGSTYVERTITVDGASGDFGGLFGWLIYARSNTGLNPTGPVGTTSDTYIFYENASNLVQDLNKLDGVTYALIGPSGTTQAFFIDTNSEFLRSQTYGIDFIHAINYLAYGGSLVIAGTTGGLNSYLNQNNNNKIDVLFDKDLKADAIQWINAQPYTIGIFPTAILDGKYGRGYTLNSFSGVSAGNAIRYFSVCGVKAPSSNISTDTLKINTKLNYEIPAVADVAGFFTRSKNLNQLYVTVAGLDRSTILNGKILNTVLWEDQLKTALRKNRVNFFVTYTPTFLGADIVGLTGGSDTVISYRDRVGPANLYVELNKIINNIGLKYVFEINNSVTRNEIVSEITTALDPFTPFLDNTKTAIICDNTNNTDNGTTLAITVLVKPLIGVDTLAINFSYTDN